MKDANFTRQCQWCNNGHVAKMYNTSKKIPWFFVKWRLTFIICGRKTSAFCCCQWCKTIDIAHNLCKGTWNLNSGQILSSLSLFQAFTLTMKTSMQLLPAIFILMSFSLTPSVAFSGCLEVKDDVCYQYCVGGGCKNMECLKSPQYHSCEQICTGEYLLYLFSW